MKKNLMFIVLFLFMFSNGLYSSDKVKGGYKNRSQYNYKYLFGEVDYNSKTLRLTNKYDSYGNVIEQIIYNSDGILNGKTVSKYDSNGNQIEQIFYNSDGILDGKTISNMILKVI